MTEASGFGFQPSGEVVSYRNRGPGDDSGAFPET